MTKTIVKEKSTTKDKPIRKYKKRKKKAAGKSKKPVPAANSNDLNVQELIAAGKILEALQGFDHITQVRIMKAFAVLQGFDL